VIFQSVSECQSTNNGQVGDFAEKSVAMPMSRPLKDWKKVRLIIYLPLGEKIVKIGAVDPERIVFKKSLKNKKERNEHNQNM